MYIYIYIYMSLARCFRTPSLPTKIVPTNKCLHFSMCACHPGAEPC